MDPSLRFGISEKASRDRDFCGTAPIRGNMSATNPKTGESKPRIAIPEPSAKDPAYSARSITPYLRALEACGGEPVVIPLDLPPEELAKRISGCAAVLLPG